jgi:hypothetical protein
MLHALWLPEITIRQGHVSKGREFVQGAISRQHLEVLLDPKSLRELSETVDRSQMGGIRNL